MSALINSGIKNPVIISRGYSNLNYEDLQLYSSTDIGALLIDGLGDGIFVKAEKCTSDQNINYLSFGILQATRTRISKTEYISCPSCGRTLFDLQETTAKIRKVTDHLKGIKIVHRTKLYGYKNSDLKSFDQPNIEKLFTENLIVFALQDFALFVFDRGTIFKLAHVAGVDSVQSFVQVPPASCCKLIGHIRHICQLLQSILPGSFVRQSERQNPSRFA